MRWTAGIPCRLVFAAVLIAPGFIRASAPVLSQTGPGQFEIASLEAGAGQRVRDEAEAAWRWLALPLDLPLAGFPSPIFVRLVPAESWSETQSFRVVAEPGGVVSVRLRWSETTPVALVRRALVQAMLVRLGVAAHGVNERLTVPFWLEQACIEWWRIHAEPAQADALQQESAGLVPPALGAVLGWQRSDVELRALSVGAVWLLTWVQSETGRSGEWPVYRARLLAGAPAEEALSECFSGRFENAAERELWWQTGWHHLRRARTQPQLGSLESHAALAELARFVFAVGEGDAVEPMRFVLKRRAEWVVKAALAERSTDLQRLLPALHPFYLNAGLALADCLAPNLKDSEVEVKVAEFEREWENALDLALTSREALDNLAATRSK
jgi:hypothetical protein